MYKIIVEPRAKEEIQNASAYYDSLDITGLADKFLDDFISTVEILQTNPNFSVKTEKYRAIPFSKFPFIAFYRIHQLENIVSIESIFHTSQNPKKHPE